MEEMDVETTLKVIIVGNGGVGKSSMMLRFCKGAYTDTYKKTIGVDFMEKELYVDHSGESMRLMLWDTAGQEEFDTITRSYYRGAAACVIVFSTTDRASFDAVRGWKQKVESEVGSSVAMVLIQNKIDLLDRAEMTVDEAEALATELGLKFFRTSVSQNVLVQEAFQDLAESALDKIGSGQLVPGAEASMGGGVGGAAEAADAPPLSSQPFKLNKPAKVRTGGKKSSCNCG